MKLFGEKGFYKKIWKPKASDRKETGHKSPGTYRDKGAGQKGSKRRESGQDTIEKSNRSILGITYVVVALFIGMIGYQGYFLIFQREDVINNTYNARLDSFSDRIVRVKIRSSNGTILAETLVGEGGIETRSYPYGPLFAHVVGYSSRGKTGLEAVGNFYMLTSHINLVEQMVREFSGGKNPGDDIYTTLDVELQQAAWDALGDRKGAVVVVEPDTGKILAMVSKPGYDPNTLNQDWDVMVADEDHQARLLNRATQGVYPPGSVFKLVTLLEYVREHPKDYGDFRFECDGIYEEGEYTIQCYDQTAHGSVDLKGAFANSCNGAFASLGLELDKAQTRKTAEELLYNSQMPLALAYSKSSFQMEVDGDTWETLQTYIGQGRTQMTPMHGVMIVSAIANGGILMKPYLIDHVEHVGGETVKQFTPEAYGSLMTAQEAVLLTEMMEAVVTVGTGSAVRTEGYSVAGKTGSAEFEKGKQTHGWFTGFAPVEKPELAISVIVEESGSGGRTAAPVARAVLDVWFGREGR